LHPKAIRLKAEHEGRAASPKLSGEQQSEGASEHPVGVHRFGWDGLPDVPKLDDAIALEAKQMDHSRATVVRFLSHMRVDGHQIAVPEGMQYFETLLWILAAVLFHSPYQCLGIPRKEWVVMAEAVACVRGERFASSARGGQAQERNGSVLPFCHDRWL
jgi:hypothetical protein